MEAAHALGGGIPGERSWVIDGTSDTGPTSPMPRPAAAAADGHGPAPHGSRKPPKPKKQRGGPRVPLPETTSQWITLGLWAVGPALIIGGTFPAILTWQLWMANFGVIFIGGIVLATQRLNRRQLASVEARPKTILIVLTALVTLCLARPELPAAASASLQAGIKAAMVDEAPAPAEPVTAEPKTVPESSGRGK